jgi:hypothetical protein
MSVDSKAEIAKQHTPMINNTIAEFEATNRDGIAAFGSELRELLLKVGLAQKKWIHHTEVIPHEDNREGELLLALRVWRLLKIHFEKGFSYTECALALTCGVPPDADGQRWMQKAKVLFEESGGMIAPYSFEMITAASGAGSHTTAVLQLLAYAMTHNAECPFARIRKLVRWWIPFAIVDHGETTKHQASGGERANRVHAHSSRNCDGMPRSHEGPKRRRQREEHDIQ